MGLVERFQVIDWVEWHQAYDRPGSSLRRRLHIVRSRLVEAISAGPSRPVLLSLCAGDGRDVLGVLRDRPDQVGRAVLVELDSILAARAVGAVKSAGLTVVEVRCQDAGAVESFIDVVPVDVLMLCGIFGNIDPAQVKRVVELIPCLVNEGGHVIWTRGGSEPDQRPEIRRWMSEAGLEEVSFDGAPETYGVGLNRLTVPSRNREILPSRLFTFGEA